MGLFGSKTLGEREARDAAIADYKAAKRALDDNSEKERKAGVRDETPEYERLNKAVNDALENPALPWWRR